MVNYSRQWVVLLDVYRASIYAIHLLVNLYFLDLPQFDLPSIVYYANRAIPLLSTARQKGQRSMNTTTIWSGKGLGVLFSVIIAGHVIAEQSTPADSELIKEGESLYNQNCVFCHQPDAIGKPGLAPSLTNPEFLATTSDKFIMSTIRDGRQGTGMVPYAHLGRKKVTAILAYLRSHSSLPNRATQVDAQPEAHGDPRLGKLWFDQICSTCHGPQGDGYLAGGSGTAIGKPGFLTKATDGYIRETIKFGRSNTRMLPFRGPEAMANLTDSEIDDIISYMRTLQN